MATTNQHSTGEDTLLRSAIRQQRKKDRCFHASLIAVLLVLFISTLTSYILFVVNNYRSQPQVCNPVSNKALCEGIEGFQALIIFITFLLIVTYTVQLYKGTLM